jgi:lipopolysaccharide cholinephosphotransferase
MDELRKMQLEIVSMIRNVDQLFKKNNIKYWLLAGSVLGSIRHKGFIPWDDDMDIAVMRCDFDKAEELLSEMELYIYEYAEKHIIPDAPIGHLHLVNDKYIIENSPTIDIFALDAIPEGKVEQYWFRFIAVIHHICVLRRPPENRGRINKVFCAILFKLIPNKIWDHIQRKSLCFIKKKGNRATEYIGNLWGDYGKKEYFRGEMFASSILSEFEGLRLPIPMHPDMYLKQLYRNYMELPPLEKRQPKHRSFENISTNEGMT